MSEAISAALKTLIQRQKKESFKDPATADNTDALGILVAHWADWDGEKIVEVFLSALQDANYHPFHRAVYEAWQEELKRTKKLIEEQQRYE